MVTPQNWVKLVRAKLRKEWNFYFYCIAKCFTNKSSNFDALTQTTQQIGFCLFQNTNFDFASMILEYHLYENQRQKGSHLL